MNSFSHFCPDLAGTVQKPFFGWGNGSTAGACFVVFWSQIFFLAPLLEMLLQIMPGFVKIAVPVISSVGSDSSLSFFR